MSESRHAGPKAKSWSWADRLRAVETENVTWLSRDFPVFWSSANGVWVEDADGQRYLDMTAAFGVAALGHGAAPIRAALHDQVDTLIHGMGDVHPPIHKVELLEKLAAISPIRDPRITLGTSGTMATEIALKAAYLHTHKPGTLSFEGGYHGLSAGSLRVIGHHKFQQPFSGTLGQRAKLIPFPDSSMEESLDQILGQVESALAEGEIGAVIVEPIQGRGGIRIPPSSFLYELLQSCRAHDSILIVDEIFTGFYRTGPSFACSEAGIEPDIVLVGKALGGGMPIGACIGTKDVMNSFGPSPGEATHTETFLGHPLSMASASALLDVFSEGGLEEAVRARGRTLGDILNGCVRGLGDHIRAVRGRGLMWGIEVSEPSTCSDIVLAALKEGLILLGGGLDGTVVQFTPPLTITDDELATFGEKFLRCVKSLPYWDEAQ